ncbi:MAG TPA: class I SAM-dependent methyltransferase [Candidatus Deferrimicrobium sp.]|nr:class I SAM-dependent methyltransferase [Candidatus Deferrimicrobium sp.]
MNLKEGKKIIDNFFFSENINEEQRESSRINLLKYAVNEAKLSGLFLEFGVWKGFSLNYLSDCRPDKIFYGFDSFYGLPEKWGSNYPKGFGYLENIPLVNDNVRLVVGLFQDTLDQFLREHKEPVSFLHLDADLFSSTKYVLNKLADEGRIKEGTIIEFDELFYQNDFNSVLNDEHRVYLDFIKKYDVKVRWLKFYQRNVTERFLIFHRRFKKLTIRGCLIIERFKLKR